MSFSENGFPPEVWGPHLWHVMHILSLNFPLMPTPKQQQAYYHFFNSLCTILPCRNCREEFCAMVVKKKSPLRLEKSLFMNDSRGRGSARMRLTRYVMLLHATVNRRLKKTNGSTMNTWIRKYESLRAR